MDRVDDIIAQWNRERPDLDVAPMALIGRIRRLSAHLGREMADTQAKFGLTPASFDVLATLRRSGPPYSLSPGELLATMMITSGTMTHRIDQLAKAGLVARAVNPDDRRSVRITLTEQGFATIEAAVTEHVATQARLTAALGADEAAALNALLSRYLTTFEGPR
ncbi:MarR family winged helix-turn-helix transcriptional regulator [Oceanibacterium hippocampi]|uniref:Multiple antibiotic resistance protein MarR n=1 Tax=Oceanibacterium hippocampi TaxID=745714 RepID=A0A1Y5S8V6_9PROT|nr:MarR family transcriptional regulator [Oceanibacterium hippocampi]SLN35096.1 Multiple antibiotic resistance protein MarR [Oceanibacterium hippocampi]